MDRLLSEKYEDTGIQGYRDCFMRLRTCPGVPLTGNLAWYTLHFLMKDIEICRQMRG